jgi:hypothetical protein
MEEADQSTEPYLAGSTSAGSILLELFDWHSPRFRAFLLSRLSGINGGCSRVESLNFREKLNPKGCGVILGFRKGRCQDGPYL